MGIRNRFSSPAHPQENGQVEVTNRTILKIIKTILEALKGKWVDESPGVLWAYRTTPRSPIGETPFTLAFDSETVILMEIGVANLRTQKPKIEQAKRELRLNLNL